MSTYLPVSPCIQWPTVNALVRAVSGRCRPWRCLFRSEWRSARRFRGLYRANERRTR